MTGFIPLNDRQLSIAIPQILEVYTYQDNRFSPSLWGQRISIFFAAPENT